MRIFGIMAWWVVLSSTAGAITCGDILTGGTHVLTADLDCAEVEAPAVTLRDGATLDLAGSRVRGLSVGVLMDGTGATLTGGLVLASTAAVRMAGTGQHTVSAVTMPIDTATDGIVIESDGNLVTDSEAHGYSVGVVIEGQGNIIRRTRATGQAGFYLSGDGNRLLGNDAMTSGFGYWVLSDGNTLLLNRGGSAEAVTVWGLGNRLIGNMAPPSSVFVDMHGDCTHNTWVRNHGGTSDPACILAPPVVGMR